MLSLGLDDLQEILIGTGCNCAGLIIHFVEWMDSQKVVPAIVQDFPSLFNNPSRSFLLTHHRLRRSSLMTRFNLHPPPVEKRPIPMEADAGNHLQDLFPLRAELSGSMGGSGLVQSRRNMIRRSEQ